MANQKEKDKLAEKSTSTDEKVISMARQEISGKDVEEHDICQLLRYFCSQ